MGPLREKEFWYAGSEFLQVSACATEQGLNEYFKKHVSQVQDLQVDAQGGKLQVRGTLSFLVSLGTAWKAGWRLPGQQLLGLSLLV